MLGARPIAGMLGGHPIKISPVTAVAPTFAKACEKSGLPVIGSVTEPVLVAPCAVRPMSKALAAYVAPLMRATTYGEEVSMNDSKLSGPIGEGAGLTYAAAGSCGRTSDVGCIVDRIGELNPFAAMIACTPRVASL